jgi:hypothetical protein
LPTSRTQAGGQDEAEGGSSARSAPACPQSGRLRGLKADTGA